MASYSGTVVEAGEAVPRACEVVVGEGALVATREDGRAFEIPFGELTVESGGLEGNVIYCRPRGGGPTVMVTAPGFVGALEEVEALAEEVARVHTQTRKRNLWKWVTAGALLGVLAAVVWLLLQVPALVAGSVDALPASVDRQLGDAAFEQMDLGGEVVEAPAAQAFLEEVIARLEPHAATEGFEFRVEVVRSDDVNAFALPGGQMVVLTGLLEAAETPDEVAGVMAHEMAHVTLRHGIRNVAWEVGLLLGLQLLLGDAEVWVQLAGEAAVLVSANAYSREQEAAADAEGARMLAAAGLDPNGIIAFFARLARLPGTELPGAMTWLSTHPAHDERIAAVRALAPTLPRGPDRPIEVDWPAVQASVE